MKVDPARRDAAYRPLFDALRAAGVNVETEYLGEFDYLLRFRRPLANAAVDSASSTLHVHRMETCWVVESYPSGRWRTDDPDAAIRATVAFARAFAEGTIAADWSAICRAHGAPSISFGGRMDDLFAQRAVRWSRYGWLPLAEADAALVYDELKRRFGSLLRPRAPTPHACWRLPKGVFERRALCDRVEWALNVAMLDALRRTVDRDGFVHAIDVNHPCYRWRPHDTPREPFCDFWAMTFLPSDDSYFFASVDCEWGVFNVWPSRMCVFGDLLTPGLVDDVSRILGPPRRMLL